MEPRWVPIYRPLIDASGRIRRRPWTLFNRNEWDEVRLATAGEVAHKSWFRFHWDVPDGQLVMGGKVRETSARLQAPNG
jgi:hypothetical protein